MTKKCLGTFWSRHAKQRTHARTHGRMDGHFCFVQVGIHSSPITWLKRFQQESLITLPRCVQFSIGKKRWRALTLSFPTLFSDWKMDTTRQSYERFLLEHFSQVIGEECNESPPVVGGHGGSRPIGNQNANRKCTVQLCILRNQTHCGQQCLIRHVNIFVILKFLHENIDFVKSMPALKIKNTLYRRRFGCRKLLMV